MNTNEAAQIIETLMQRYNLHTNGWTWRWSRSKKNHGSCVHNLRELRFSSFHTARVDIDEFTDTVVHEIAHALCGFSEGHGSKWKATAIAMGGTGNVYGSRTPIDAYAWQGRCPVGHRTWAHSRPRTLGVGCCGSCYRRFGEYRLIEWKHNGVPVTVTAEQTLAMIQKRTTSAGASAARTAEVKAKRAPKKGGTGGAYSGGFVDIEALWND